MGDDYSSVVLLRLGYDGLFLMNATSTSSRGNLTNDHYHDPPTPTLTTTTTTNNNNNNNNKWNVSLNDTKLRLVLVGDSLSRYMYLSLVYFVKNGGTKWVPSGHELLEKVKDGEPDAWNAWLAYTNRELDYEVCDCYRYWKHPFKWYKHCENRYYHWNGHAIAFITKFGGNPFHGHVPASDIFPINATTATATATGTTSTTLTPFGINQTKRDYDWVYPTWDGLIEHYISRWNPKPTILLFNQGHWKGHELRDVKVLKTFRRALKKHGIRGIYRTTTFRQDERVLVDTNTNTTDGSGRGNGLSVEQASYAAFRHADTRQHDGLVCQYFECLNVSWTAGIPTTEYVDAVHFKASITNRMNVQFLEEFVLGS